MGFDESFNSLVQLKRDRLGLEANQQQFNQNEAFFRREGDLQAQRLGNERSRFDIDRSKGFMPIDMANARIGLQNTMNSAANQQDQADLSKRLGQIDIENRTTDQLRSGNDYNYQLGRRKEIDSQQDADYAHRGVVDMQQSADYNYQAERQRLTDARQDADYVYQAGRRNLTDQRSDTEYGAGKALSVNQSGYRSSPYSPPLLQQGSPAIQSRSRYADGGPIQDVAPKGFSPVPVRVSNGEYELTPEQVTAIGAALLASKNQPAPVGLGDMQ